jgi:glycosyltransferase involved in cell wall biosynthesis
MAPLTVAFDTGPLHGPRTGIGFAVQAIHDALNERDDVTLLDYVLSFRAELTPGTRRLPLPAALAQRAWARSDLPRVDRWLGDVDVVHGTNYVVPPSRVPSVVSVYDCWFLRHPEQAGDDVRRAGDVLRRAIDHGAVVHTSSHATEAVVRELFPQALVQTIHLGPLTPSPPAALAPVAELEGRPFVLAVGTLERRKNVPTLVRAFGRIAADVPQLRLVLAGSDGDDTAVIRSAIDRLGPQLAPRVLLTGRVDDEVRGWLQHHATVLAYPSLDEGFGFPLLDAMQSGVPVVASTAGSIPEVAGDAALLGAPDDVDLLAENLVRVITEPELRQRLITAGTAQWQRFSWQRCADELADLYRRVAAGEMRPESRGNAR